MSTETFLAIRFYVFNGVLSEHEFNGFPSKIALIIQVFAWSFIHKTPRLVAERVIGHPLLQCVLLNLETHNVG